MSIIYDFKLINQSANSISRHLLWPADQTFAKPIDDSRSSLVRYRETLLDGRLHFTLLENVSKEVERKVFAALSNTPATQQGKPLRGTPQVTGTIMHFEDCYWVYDLEHDRWIDTRGKDAPA